MKEISVDATITLRIRDYQESVPDNVYKGLCDMQELHRTRNADKASEWLLGSVGLSDQDAEVEIDDVEIVEDYALEEEDNDAELYL